MYRSRLIHTFVTHANMKGLGLTPLFRDHRGFMPPQLKTKQTQSATTPRVQTLKRSLACFEGIQRESPSYADARSIDMRMYTLQEVPKDLRAPSFRLERIGRRLSMTSLLEHVYVSTFVDFPN